MLSVGYVACDGCQIANRVPQSIIDSSNKDRMTIQSPTPHERLRV